MICHWRVLGIDRHDRKVCLLCFVVSEDRAVALRLLDQWLLKRPPQLLHLLRRAVWVAPKRLDEQVTRSGERGTRLLNHQRRYITQKRSVERVSIRSLLNLF
jgi:hypothetical protein